MSREREPGNGVRRGALDDSPWGDLLRLAADPAVAAPRRREAERLLIVRIAGLSRGERISVARRATRPVLAALLGAVTEPDVARAALWNPRVVEADVVRVASDPRTRSTVLSTVGDCEPWSDRRTVRLALARNARTPARTALRAVAGLGVRDLEGLARDPDVPPLVRLRAGRDFVNDLSRSTPMGYE